MAPVVAGEAARLGREERTRRAGGRGGAALVVAPAQVVECERRRQVRRQITGPSGAIVVFDRDHVRRVLADGARRERPHALPQHRHLPGEDGPRERGRGEPGVPGQHAGGLRHPRCGPLVEERPHSSLLEAAAVLDLRRRGGRDDRHVVTQLREAPQEVELPRGAAAPARPVGQLRGEAQDSQTGRAGYGVELPPLRQGSATVPAAEGGAFKPVAARFRAARRAARVRPRLSARPRHGRALADSRARVARRACAAHTRRAGRRTRPRRRPPRSPTGRVPRTGAETPPEGRTWRPPMRCSPATATRRPCPVHLARRHSSPCEGEKAARSASAGRTHSAASTTTSSTQ